MKTYTQPSPALEMFRNWLMLAVLALALPQIYTVSIAGTYLPMSLLPVVICFPFLKARKQDTAILLSVLLQYFFAVLSVLWSNNLGAWGSYLLFGFIFPACFFLGRRIKVSKIELGLKLFSLIAAAHSALIAVFRLYPDLKLAFLFSGALKIFKNPERLVGYERGDVALNIFDPLKSGGIFDNANTASTFTLVAIGALVAIRSALPRPVFIVLISLLVIGVIASGSKSGTFYLVVLSALLYFALRVSTGSPMRRLVMVYTFVVGAALLSIVWTNISGTLLGTDVGQDTLKTGSYRIQLLLLAVEVLQKHWFMGVGFGGWADVMASRASYYGLDPTWPPHNSLLQAWIETGVMGLITLLTTWFLLLKRTVRSALSGVVGAGGALFALVAAAGMSMGDPTPLFGAPQFAPALGFVLALVLNRRDEQAHGPQAGV